MLKNLKQVLTEHGHEVKGNSLACPFCDDVHPSASVYTYEGKEFLKCFKCGKAWTAEQVESKLENKPNKKRFNVSTKKYTLEERLANLPPHTLYKYTNPDTNEVDLIVVRIDKENGKDFRQLTNVKGSWEFKGLKKNPIYNRTRVLGAKEVIVVEGEKCVHHLHTLGLIGTTSPGGAQAADKADWSPLYGKTVFLWPDNDEPGMSYVRAVKEQLGGRCKVREVDPTFLPNKGDVADITGPMAKECILEALDRSSDVGPLSEILEEVELMRQGITRPVRWPFDGLTDLTKSLRPSAVTILCGPAGSSKSFLVLQSVAHWLENNIRVSCLMMEETRTWHLYRALAQREGNPFLQDADWQVDHVEKLATAVDCHRDWLDTMGRSIYEAGRTITTARDIMRWITRSAEAGSRVIIVDPITAKDPDKSYTVDHELIFHAKNEAKAHGCSVIMTTHPTKGREYNKDGRVRPSMSSIAGGNALEKFSAAVLWLEAWDRESQITQKGMHSMTETVEHNRTIHILKTRDGMGTNAKLAYNFNNDLNFTELGRII